MQLNQFEYLVAVDRYGSISRVAQELYVSQSTVSVALINLEKELGISILQRGKRGVTFTPEGAIVLDKAKIIMEQVNALKSAKINEKDFSGEIKIGSSTHFGMSIITDVIIQIKKLYPKIALFTKRSYVKEIIKAVSLKELDIGLIMYNSLNELDIKTELKRNSLDFTEFFQDRQSICVGADHPLLEKEEVYVADLLPYDFISLHTLYIHNQKDFLHFLILFLLIFLSMFLLLFLETKHRLQNLDLFLLYTFYLHMA